MSEPITPGDQVVLSCVFTNTANEPDEPATVTLTLVEPAAEALSPGRSYVPSPGPTKTKTAEWSYEYEPEVPGRWYWRWDGDGVAASEGSFVIARSLVR